MKKFEKYCSIILGIMLSGKLLGILGFNVFFVLFAFILSLFYFFCSFPLITGERFGTLLRSNVSKILKFKSVVFGYGLFLLIIGIVYVVQHWIGGFRYLISGLVICSLLWLNALVCLKRKIDLSVNEQIFNRTLIFLIFGIIALSYKLFVNNY